MNAPAREITLDDKYVLERGRVYMTGIQALARLPIDISRRDRRAGLDTGGYISGYRGSPLAGYDEQLLAARRFLDAAGIVFQPGVNEEMAATAVWGSQKVGVSGRSDRDGVFGLWYGKAPGVDRTLDVFRHANASGTAAAGGALAIAGDDHMAKSSSLPAQSEFAFAHAEIPVLSPSDLQEVLDYGLHGIAMSRFAGLWVALIALADTMDSSGVVDVDPDRPELRRPRDIADPRTLADLNKPTRLATRLESEALTRDLRLPAAKAYARANGLDRVAFGAERPRLGIVASGKAYRDLRQTFALMGIDEEAARGMGLGVFKVAMPWPLEPTAISAFARGLERVLVVESKRALIEPQLKDIAYHWPARERPAIWGKATPEGGELLPSVRECAPAEIAPAVLAFLPEGMRSAAMEAGARRIAERHAWAGEHAGDAARTPYFCSGCPHNVSTLAPEGARTIPGIGCHAMTEIAGRATDGLVAMGGEGAPWLGQFPFSKDRHAFANLGDGTYYHSGILAIRAAVAAKAPITYKLLYNDAVAMTGGQKVDGPLDVPRILAQLAAEGVERLALVSERPQLYRGAALPAGVQALHRDELMRVQAEFAAFAGPSVIVFDQTCAAEKRRRRKSGGYEDPPKRLFINDRVCEDCGDCSVQSNCISVEPLETAFGRKRRINQSSCNKDYSCAKGFCPSFVTVEGAEPRRARGDEIDVEALVAGLPRAAPAAGTAPVNLLFTGIGGTGVTTAAAVLAMAAHIDGLEVTTLDMTGLAQKNGPVTSHVRIARRGAAIEGPRVPAGALDGLLAADLVVAAGAETLALCAPDRTRAIWNADVAPTADFAMHQSAVPEAGRLGETVAAACAEGRGVNATRIAERLFGDAIFANMLMVGSAWQAGLVPVAVDAIERAIALNGVAAERNVAAFHAGRALAGRPEAFASLFSETAPAADTPLEARIDVLAAELARYQDAAYAARFRRAVERVQAAEARWSATFEVTRAAAESLYRLMAYKDEYEVARLYAEPAFREKLEAQFEEGGRISVQLAPPLLARTDPRTGRPRKISFGPWVFTLFRLLARVKGLRGTALDPFGRTAERRTERALIAEFEATLATLAAGLDRSRLALAAEIATVPQDIRGYGPVKAANLARARQRHAALMARWDAPDRHHDPAPALEAAE